MIRLTCIAGACIGCYRLFYAEQQSVQILHMRISSKIVNIFIIIGSLFLLVVTKLFNLKNLFYLVIKIVCKTAIIFIAAVLIVDVISSIGSQIVEYCTKI